jgi:Undecaprenyl-phosphate glucose phosphotransferase
MLPRQISNQTLSRLVGAAEVCVIAAAAVLGDAVYQHLWLYQPAATDPAVGTGLIAACIFISLARAGGLYQLPSLMAPSQKSGKILMAWAIGLLIVTAVLFLLKVGTYYSRGSFLTFSVFGLLLIFSVRFAAGNRIHALLAKGAITGRSAIVIGDSLEIDRLRSGHFLHHCGIKEIGEVILDVVGMGESDVTQRRVALEEAMIFARQKKADEFLIAASWNQIELLAEVTALLRNSPLPVRLLPDQIIRSILDRRSAASAAHMLTVEIQRAPMSLFERALKRTFDFVLAFIGLLLISPLLMATALAIKLDSSGPVIFKQRRKGFDERQFAIFKFRSMSVLEDGGEIVQAKRDDQRVTCVGRWLRRTSIDELPQLFNVLKGDMSLVGPRPHALAHDDQYKALLETYCWRHHVKPGITGWAQVNGLRGETIHLEQMQRRVEYDIWYINNWSFILDMRILIRTCFEVLKHEAY